MIGSPAPRNKTIVLSPREECGYAKKAIKLSAAAEPSALLDKIVWQDTFNALRHVPDNFADLMIVDPPYNLTKNFGKNTFYQMDLTEYKKWLDKWLFLCYNRIAATVLRGQSRNKGRQQ